MGTQLDFMQYLESDMALNIMGCLDDAADLIHTSSVSRLWRDFGELYSRIWLDSFSIVLPCTRHVLQCVNLVVDVSFFDLLKLYFK